MRRLAFLLVLLLAARGAWGQMTTVSATIADASGQAWKQGTYTFFFRTSPLNPTSTYYLNGVPFPTSQQTIAGHMDTTGSFSVSVPSNTSITPSGSTWDVQVCPISQGNTTCFTQRSITITGATQSLSAVVIPPAALIDLAHPAYPFVIAYTNAEFSTAPMGGIYYDYTQAHYFLCTNVTPSGQAQWYGSCLTWKEFCLVGDGLCAGASNCPPNTFDTGILTEHPLGTCYDSSHATWNDGVGKQVLLFGDGTSTVTSDVSEVFNFGPSNTIKDVALTGFIVGDANNLWGISSGSIANELYIIGDANNNQRNTSESYIIGSGNGIQDAQSNMFIYGIANHFKSGTASTQVTMHHGFALGGSNNATANVGSALSNFGFTGFGNSVTVSNSHTITGVYLHGASNSATLTTNNDHDIYALGTSNTFEDDLNLTEQAMALGFGNDIDGANSTAQTLGLSNILHNVSINGGNTVVVGGVNAATNLGTVGTQYQEVFGHSNNLNNCSDCIAIGANVNEATNHEMGIGMAAIPALKVDVNGSGDNILRTPHPFAYYPTCVSAFEGSFAAINNSTTGAQGATITGGGSFHVLGYCNGANWVVASGSGPPAILAAPTLCNLGSNINSIPAATPQVIITCAATAPSSGCPCRAFVSWTILGGGTSSTEQVEGIISDGTSNFAGTAGDIDNQITTGFKGIARSDYSPNLYSNSQAVTFTLTGESDHTWSAVTTSFYLSAPTQVRVTYLSSN